MLNSIIQNTIKKEILKRVIPNYHINLLNVNKIEQVSQFKTDLQVVFGMLKYRNDKQKNN